MLGSGHGNIGGMMGIRFSHIARLAVVGSALVLAGCSSVNPPATPHFEHHGPMPVGVTTIDLGPAGSLGERSATVYYPADRPRLAGHDRFSYVQSDTLPTQLKTLLPEEYNTRTDVNAFVDAPAFDGKAAPVVLFSHGFGGQRLEYSNLLAGIASWGYVVVSADYLERGIASQALKLTTRPSAADDQKIMFASLSKVIAASHNASSPLYGAVDETKVAAAGHSAGGGTAFNALKNPKVATAIGWAPVPPKGQPSSKPVMLIGTAGDIAIRPRQVSKTYESFGGPRTLVEVAGEGHNTFTDVCSVIRQGGGLIRYAVANNFTTESLAKLGINGCEKTDTAPEKFWPIVQYFTVAQLMKVFGGSSAPIPTPPSGTFPDFKISVTQGN